MGVMEVADHKCSWRL